LVTGQTSFSDALAVLQWESDKALFTDHKRLFSPRVIGRQHSSGRPNDGADGVVHGLALRLADDFAQHRALLCIGLASIGMALGQINIRMLLEVYFSWCQYLLLAATG
jgi:hypothetical protein